VLNSETDNIEEAVRSITGKGADAMLDAVGGALGTIMFNVAATYGRIIVYGRLSNDSVNFSNGTVVYKNLQIEGFGIDRWISTQDETALNAVWDEITTRVSNGTLQVGHDKTFELPDFKEAIAYYKQTGKRAILK
jgi:NADPH:quinone reductase-like Zn-dependent oxidoreductase